MMFTLDLVVQHFVRCFTFTIKQIRHCSDAQRDKLSQEISILQAIVTKDKSKVPGYLKYPDRGNMYFSDVSFIPFIRQIDQLVKDVVNEKKMQEDGGEIIKVCAYKTKFGLYTVMDNYNV